MLNNMLRQIEKESLGFELDTQRQQPQTGAFDPTAEERGTARSRHERDRGEIGGAEIAAKRSLAHRALRFESNSVSVARDRGARPLLAAGVQSERRGGVGRRVSSRERGFRPPVAEQATCRHRPRSSPSAVPSTFRSTSWCSARAMSGASRPGSRSKTWPRTSRGAPCCKASLSVCSSTAKASTPECTRYRPAAAGTEPWNSW